MKKNCYEILDIIKLLSCLLILLHHWSIYVYSVNIGSDNLLVIFFNSFRYVTATFFVISGFLFYEKWFYSHPQKVISVKTEWLKTFSNIAPPYYFTIFLNIFVIVVINLLSHQHLLKMPSFKDIFFNMFMMQDIFHIESISAGLWYIIIHLQNAIVSLTIVKIFKNHPSTSFAMFFILWFVSTFYFSLFTNYDNLFIYFFYSYGIGFFAGFALRKNIYSWIGFSVLTLLALSVSFRPRLALAFLSASFIVCYFYYFKTHSIKLNRYIRALSEQVLYLFLFHYPILITLNTIPMPKNEIKTYIILFMTIILDIWLSSKFLIYFKRLKRVFNMPND